MITRIGMNTNTHAKTNTNFKANLTDNAKKIILENANKVDTAKVQEFLADKSTKHLKIDIFESHFFNESFFMAVKSEKAPLYRDGDNSIPEGFGVIIDKFKTYKNLKAYQNDHPRCFPNPKFVNEDHSITMPSNKKLFKFHELFDLENIKNFEKNVLIPRHEKELKNIMNSEKSGKEAQKILVSDKALRKFQNLNLVSVIKNSAKKGEFTEEHLKTIQSLVSDTNETIKIKFVKVPAYEPPLSTSVYVPSSKAKIQVLVSSELYPKAGYQTIREVPLNEEGSMNALLDGLHPLVNNAEEHVLPKIHNQKILEEMFATANE